MGWHPGLGCVCGVVGGDAEVSDGCLAPTLTYATSGGLSGVVRAAVEAKGRVPS